MPSVSMELRVVSFPIIFDLHDGATIVSISMVDNMLYSSIRKVVVVLSLDITSLITISFFTKVCVILVIMNSILKMERIWLFIIMISTMSPNYTTYTTSRGRKAECRNSKKTTDKQKSNHCYDAKS